MYFGQVQVRKKDRQSLAIENEPENESWIYNNIFTNFGQNTAGTQ